METIATTKGQIVIPSKLRTKLGINEGTRIKIVYDENNKQIILKPITKESIKKFRGILKLKPGQKSATEQLYTDRKADKKREEQKLGKYGS